MALPLICMDCRASSSSSVKGFFLGNVDGALPYGSGSVSGSRGSTRGSTNAQTFAATASSGRPPSTSLNRSGSSRARRRYSSWARRWCCGGCTANCGTPANEHLAADGPGRALGGAGPAAWTRQARAGDPLPAKLQPFAAQVARRSMIVKKAKPLAIECVVRGYLAGSGWKEY